MSRFHTSKFYEHDNGVCGVECRRIDRHRVYLDHDVYGPFHKFLSAS